MPRLLADVLSTAVLVLAAATASAQVGTQPTVPENPYTPPACVAGVPFADVTCTTPYDAWIEQFAADSITGGCGNGNYCPTLAVTRNQMAVFIERAMRGTGTWSPGDRGHYNTGVGAGALLNNSPYAIENTAVGTDALQTQSYANGNVQYGTYNTAVGTSALYANQPDGGNSGYDGTANTALGDHALSNNTTGFDDVGVGEDAGFSNLTGYGITIIGANANVVTDGYVDATAIGYQAYVDASYHVRIGDSNVTQIGGQVAWSNLSDARAKKDIRPLDLGLDFVMALRPVSFQLINGNGRTDMGFVAQDVEALLGDEYNVLGIGADADRTLSLRYTDFIAPLVEAVQQQQATITAQRDEIATLKAQLAPLEQASEGQQAINRRLAARLAAVEAELQAIAAR